MHSAAGTYSFVQEQKDNNMEMSIIEGYLSESITIDQRSYVSFAKEDVLYTTAEREQRRKELQHAAILGSVLGERVKLLTETVLGLVTIQSQIHYTTEKDVVLQSGDRVPIRAILSVSQIESFF